MRSGQREVRNVGQTVIGKRPNSLSTAKKNR